MNTNERYVYKKCSACRKHLVLTTEFYDKDKGEYITLKDPICGDCKLRLELYNKDNKNE